MNLLVGHRARLNAIVARKEALLYCQIVGAVAWNGVCNCGILVNLNLDNWAAVGGAAQLYVVRNMVCGGRDGISPRAVLAKSIYSEL